MNPFALPPLIAFILVLSIGLFVFFNNIRSKTHVTFGLLCFSAAWWLFGFSLMYLSLDPRMALQWARIGFLGIIFIPVFAYHFISEFTGSEAGKKITYIAYLLSIPSLIFSQSDLIYAGIRSHFYGFYPAAGRYYILFLLMFAVLFTHGIILLLMFSQKLKKQHDSARAQQAKYVLIAFVFGATGLVDYIAKFPLPLYPFGYFSAFLLIATVAYAVLRHRLMDIEVVIKRGLVYSLLTAIITGAFLSVILIWERVFVGITGQSSLWGGIIVAFLISLIFQPLRAGVQDVIDRYFFRVRYDYQRILGKYSHALAQPMVNLDRFARLAPYLLSKSMGLSGASVAVLDRETHRYVVRAGERGAREIEGESLADDSHLMKEVLARMKGVSLDEVKARLKNENLPESEVIKLKQIIADMNKLRSVLVIPCISESHYFKKPTLLATLNLGKKMSDEDFSREDIEFLRTLANQATISIEYAFIFEELTKQQERVVKAEKLAVIGTTTAGVAHELRNPLTYLSAVAQVLNKKWDDPEFKKSVSQMLPAEVVRMQLIVDGLLDYSRTRELTLKPLDVKAVVEKTTALLAFDIKKNKIYVKADYRHTAKASGDPNRLMQVFVNLMGNAVQAMDKGGDLNILTEDGEGEVRVSISDTGHGIPPEKLKQIFDPFFTTKEGGTGLGLSISKKIIEEHKGSIFVESVPDRGTTFTVCLPAA